MGVHLTKIFIGLRLPLPEFLWIFFWEVSLFQCTPMCLDWDCSLEFLVNPSARLRISPRVHDGVCKWRSQIKSNPNTSMYGIFTYTGVVLGINVGIYGIHGVSGKHELSELFILGSAVTRLCFSLSPSLHCCLQPLYSPLGFPSQTANERK